MKIDNNISCQFNTFVSTLKIMVYFLKGSPLIYCYIFLSVWNSICKWFMGSKSAKWWACGFKPANNSLRKGNCLLLKYNKTIYAHVIIVVWLHRDNISGELVVIKDTFNVSSFIFIMIYIMNILHILNANSICCWIFLS